MSVLSAGKLRRICNLRGMKTEGLAEQLVRSGLNRRDAVKALKNWQKGLFNPKPRSEDIDRLATALSVEQKELISWRSSYKYAPMSARKVRLVTELIVGRSVQDAMDILKFTRKRAASIVNKVLKSAVADADEQQADVDELYVADARVDDAGVRFGTKRWIAKDRGRAHPIRKTACHIYITVSEGRR
jgi:large subunit ribosomal protein L22